MPRVDALPLFMPVPVRLTVTCMSPKMHSGNQNDPFTFDFPRAPKLTEINISVVLSTTINAETFKFDLLDNLGLVGGFGLHKANHLNSQLEDGVTTEVSPLQ